MNKTRIAILSTLCVLMALASFTACRNPLLASLAPLPSYTVTYDSQGGSALAQVTVKSGTTISIFPVPVREGYTFVGWFDSPAATGSPIAALTVTADITLYAKWLQNAVPVTITFNAQGGTAVAAVTQNTGTTIENSPVTTNAGYDFGGWFDNQACEGDPVSFPYLITGNAILWAKWTIQENGVRVTGVTLSEESIDIPEGMQFTLVATVAPIDATNKTLFWSTDAPSVATVLNGVVSALAPGNATITVRTQDGSFTDTCQVTCLAAELVSLGLSASAEFVYEGQTLTLEASATYSNGTIAVVDPSYTLNDAAVASIAAGVLTGLKAGAVPAIVTGSYTEGAKTEESELTIPVRYDGIRILVAQSLGYGNIYWWDCDRPTDYPNSPSWPGSPMSTSGTDYVKNFAECSAVKLLIANAGGAKLFATDMVVSSKGVYRVTALGIAEEEYQSPAQPIKIYMAASAPPLLWLWEVGGKAISVLMGYDYNTNHPTMAPATDLKWNAGWYVFSVPSEFVSGNKVISFKLNKGPDTSSGKTGTFWFDGTTYYDADPTVVPEPVAPTVSIKPASGDIPLRGSITLSYTDGHDAANLTVTASVNALSYDASDFTNGSLTIPVSSITTTAGTAINVSITATNGVGSDTKTASLTAQDIALDRFTWDNALVYFVMTDRFNNGNPANDYSYYRKNNASSGIPDVATFHGGDIAGLTAKMDYFDDLGVNAIWITAPYEQVHGWVSGGGAFPHYAFHGYYTLDWTFMDKNMGTISEFRTFVNEAHSRGIRVVIDIVLNHAGYNTLEDMITYDFGSTTVTTHGWIDGGASWTNNHAVTDYSSPRWDRWWSSWVRAFDGNWGYEPPEGGDLKMSLAGLPDVVTEKTGSYTIPTFLQVKWDAENNASYDDWRLPAASGLRQNLGIAPADYIIKWLAAWVEEFGIDGFRVDTAKHVDMYRWGQLKVAAQTALEAWRASARSNGSPAKTWDEDFWMTGECFGWNNSVTGDYFSTGKFDSMINFHFQPVGNTNGSSSGTTPTVGDWSTLASMINGPSNTAGNNMLSYISSHDTGLHRPADMKNVGTMTLLLPGGVQIFYGDELARPYAYANCGDSDMQTRGNMNWTGYDASLLAHWQKVGQFRENHPAVGAGTQTTIEANTYGRSYSGSAGDDVVVIKLGTGAVNVTGFFADGTVVRNAYDGATGTVSGGSVTFAGSVSPILVELAE